MVRRKTKKKEDAGVQPKQDRLEIQPVAGQSDLKAKANRTQLLSAKETAADLKSDATLRPQTLDEYVGRRG